PGTPTGTPPDAGLQARGGGGPAAKRGLAVGSAAAQSHGELGLGRGDQRAETLVSGAPANLRLGSRRRNSIDRGGARVDPPRGSRQERRGSRACDPRANGSRGRAATRPSRWDRSEEHTSELQSLAYLVCR